MKNIWAIFRRDMEKLTESVVPVVVIIGLCLVPCLYAWFNIMSNADPYGPSSTSNIKVAVASEDKGSELFGLELNIGDMVVDGIKGNSQMGWCFVDTREEAMDGLYAGDYYAALIVPKDFTKNFLSILDGELVHPEVEYYENEKKNAIAPKITSKAKTAVQDQINSTIVEKTADALNTVSSMFNAFGIDSDNVADNLTKKMDDACEKLETTCKLLRSVKTLAADTQNLLEVGAITLDDAGQVMIDGGAVSHQTGVTAGTIYDSSVTMQENTYEALNSIDQDLANMIDLWGAWAGNPNLSDEVGGSLENAKAYVQTAQTQQYPIIVNTNYGDVIAQIGELQNMVDYGKEKKAYWENSNFPDKYITASNTVISALNTDHNNAVVAGNYINDAYIAANDVYNSLVGVTPEQTDFSALSNALSTASRYVNMSEEQALLETAQTAYSGLNYDTAAMYIDELSVSLEYKYNSVQNELTCIDNALSEIGYAHQLVEEEKEKREFYFQTLDMLEADATLAASLGLTSLESSLRNLQTRVKNSGNPTNAQSFINQATEIREQLTEAALNLNENVNTMIQDSAQSTQETMAALEDLMIMGADGAVSLADTMQRFAVAMNSSQLTLDEAIDLSEQVYEYVKSVADDVRRMVNSDAFRQAMDVLENNPEGLAEYLVSPVDMRTVIVYEIADYGSAMSPYYIMLALFVGSLLSVAMIKPLIHYPEFEHVPQIQKYFGRLLLFVFIGQFQALVTSLGCLYYVKIQCVNPLLFVLGCMLISFNFVMMNYSFSYALDNVGLAASVIIMVIQVAGSGGSYPVHVLPEVFQALYPFMPFHYGMDLVRECVGGFYQGTYIKCVLMLLLMCVIFFVIGITLFRPMKKLNEIIAESKEASGVM